VLSAAASSHGQVDKAPPASSARYRGHRYDTIRLIDLRLQHGPHVPRLDTDHRQTCFDQSAVRPLRQWSGFQPHPLEAASAVLQQWQ
jgi:hypothetical protein